MFNKQIGNDMCLPVIFNKRIGNDMCLPVMFNKQIGNDVCLPVMFNKQIGNDVCLPVMFNKQIGNDVCLPVMINKQIGNDVFTVSCVIHLSVTMGVFHVMFKKRIGNDGCVPCIFQWKRSPLILTSVVCFVKDFKRLYIRLSRSEVVPSGVYNTVTLSLAVSVPQSTKHCVQLHGSITVKLG